MIDLFTADDLDQLARRVAEIRPMSNSNPDAFYEERSEVAHQIRELATRLRGGPAATADPVIKAVLPRGTKVVFAESITVDGRTCRVVKTKRWPLASDNRP